VDPDPYLERIGSVFNGVPWSVFDQKKIGIKNFRCFFSFLQFLAVSRIRDPVPFLPLDPGSGIRDGKKVSIRIRDEQPGSYFLELRNHFLGFFGLKYLNSLMRIRDPRSGMETGRIRDPGWKKVGSGIQDKHPGSATLVFGHQNPGSGLDPDPESKNPDPQLCRTHIE
jgi:hypothetical protein